MLEANQNAFDKIHKFVLGFDSENFKEKKEKLCIETNEEEKEILQYARITNEYKIYNKFSFIELEFNEKKYIITKGLSDLTLSESDLKKYQYKEVCGGVFTILLSEGFIQPKKDKGGIFSLYDKFLYDDKDSLPRKIPHLELKSYFEEFQMLEILSDSLNSERVFGCLILEGNKHLLHSSIETDLIKRTFENGSEILPFKKIIKSLLYYDEPKHLFLEVYRCIERLYSLPAMEKLKEKLKDNANVEEVCVFTLSEVVENAIGWRQSEEAGLKMLITDISDSELDSALQFFDKTSLNTGLLDIEADSKEAIQIEDDKRKQDKLSELKVKKANFIAKRIYKSRNSFVHFREVHATPYVEEEGIPYLCNLLFFLLDPIYSEFN